MKNNSAVQYRNTEGTIILYRCILRGTGMCFGGTRKPEGSPPVREWFVCVSAGPPLDQEVPRQLLD